MKDITLISHLNSLTKTSSPTNQAAAPGFSQALSRAIDETVKAEAVADDAVKKFTTGDNKALHEVMISMEKADLSLRMLVQMRNKVVEAYQEVMRMQV